MTLTEKKIGVPIFFGNVPELSRVSRKNCQVSRFPEKSPDSRNNFSYVPKQRLLELSPPVSFWHGRDRGLSVFGAFSGLPRTPQKFCSLKPHFKTLSWQLSTALSGRASILPFGRICGCCWQAQWRLGGSLRIFDD